MTDPTVTPPAPAGPLERWGAVIGNLARPFSIYAIGLAIAAAIVKIAFDGKSFVESAAFFTPIFTGFAALYAAKSMENAAATKHSAQVEVAKAAGSPQ